MNLSTITGTLRASNASASRSSAGSSPEEIKVLIPNHNEEAERLRSSLALMSSTGNPDVGGFTDADISFRGTLEKYYRESFGDHIGGGRFVDLDKISDHKNRWSSGGGLSWVVSYRDRAFAEKFLNKGVIDAQKNDRRTECVLANLENLGHASELTCEGLTVEMLEFQKQSLKWAMERETTPGGIQSYFWPKVPINGSELYFNPITQNFRTTKPREVRGGIIADEMGLGKVRYFASLDLVLARIFLTTRMLLEDDNIFGIDPQTSSSDESSKRK